MRRPHVLLVEDDQPVRDALSIFFEKFLDVTPAGTGAQALSSLDTPPVDAVVLDYRLPDCTGLDLLRGIKTEHPSLPVIMMTGCGSEWLCASAFKLGVRDYFAKPFNALDLVASVRRILSVSAQPAEPRENVLAQPDRCEPNTDPPREPPDCTIMKAVRVIQQRYWDHLSLAQLAREAGLSRSHFSRRFKEVMGVTFREYLIALRLEKAKALLPGKRLSVTEVAQIVGFCDLPYFDKLFKRATGLTPSAYRSGLSA